MDADLAIPDWLSRKLTDAERADAWQAYPKPVQRAPVVTAEALALEREREAIAQGRAIDAEVCALLEASRAQRERLETAARIAAIPAEAKEIAKLKKPGKPLRANACAAKPKRRQRRKVNS